MKLRVVFVSLFAAACVVLSLVYPDKAAGFVPVLGCAFVFMASEVKFQHDMRRLQEDRAERWKAIAEERYHVAMKALNDYEQEFMLRVMTQRPPTPPKPLDLN